MKKIIQLQKFCSIHGRPLDLNIENMHSKYKQTLYNYRLFRKIASTTLTTFQDNMIEKIALAGKTEASAIRK